MEAMPSVSTTLGPLPAPKYGAGLRLIECLRRQVQHIDFSRNELPLRDARPHVHDSTIQKATETIYHLIPGVARLKGLQSHGLSRFERWGAMPRICAPKVL